MEVHACLQDGRLAFKFGDVPGVLFGKKTPAPRHITVTDTAIEGAFERRVMWDAEKYANTETEPEERTLVYYGERLVGLTINHPPKKLRPGRKYRVSASAGPDVGGEEFTFSASLPACSAVKFTA